MRNQFYSDNRDLVKWGALLHLAREHGIQLILQMAYLRPDNGSFTLTVTSSEAERTIDFPSEVWSHFPRNIHRIKDLAKISEFSIELFDEPFEKPYEEYTRKAVAWMQRYGEKKIVFLDPDTGIAPQKPDASGGSFPASNADASTAPRTRRTLKHVSAEEIGEIFAAMRAGDVLVLYQHERLFRENWLDESRSQFARALGCPREAITTITSPNVSDVAFFALSKSP